MSSWKKKNEEHSNHGRRLVRQQNCRRQFLQVRELSAGGLLPEQEFPTNDTQHDRRLVFRRRTVGEPESTVPATQLVLAVGGLAVDDVPDTVLDALGRRFCGQSVVRSVFRSVESHPGLWPWMKVTRTHWCPQTPDVDAGDSSVDTESMDGREDSVMGPEDPVPHVEEDLELLLRRGAVRICREAGGRSGCARDARRLEVVADGLDTTLVSALRGMGLRTVLRWQLQDVQKSGVTLNWWGDARGRGWLCWWRWG